MTQAIDNLGAHLMGRHYVYDERDWPLEAFVALEQWKRTIPALRGSQATIQGESTTVDLDAALTAVMKTRASAITKAFDLAVVTTIKAWYPAPTPPAPTPTPPSIGIEYMNPSPNQDQGQTPECVGGAWANMGNTDPVNDNWPENQFDVIYKICKEIDGDTEDGSSTRSGAQAMQRLGRITNYAFTESVDTIVAWLLSGKGSIVTGTDWTSDAFEVDTRNFLHFDGDLVGGHEWLLVGVRSDLHALVGCTSWGAFGANRDGRFLVDIDEYAALLARQGDACAAVELPA